MARLREHFGCDDAVGVGAGDDVPEPEVVGKEPVLAPDVELLELVINCATGGPGIFSWLYGSLLS